MERIPRNEWKYIPHSHIWHGVRSRALCNVTLLNVCAPSTVFFWGVCKFIRHFDRCLSPLAEILSVVVPVNNMCCCMCAVQARDLSRGYKVYCRLLRVEAQLFVCSTSVKSYAAFYVFFLCVCAAAEWAMTAITNMMLSMQQAPKVC